MSKLNTCLRLKVDSYDTVIVQQLSAVRCFDNVNQANGAKGRICWSLCAHLANTLLGACQTLTIPSQIYPFGKSFMHQTTGSLVIKTT